jgi:hypothetical protein
VEGGQRVSVRGDWGRNKQIGTEWEDVMKWPYGTVNSKLTFDAATAALQGSDVTFDGRRTSQLVLEQISVV